MKKTTRPIKLTLKRETVKALKFTELTDIVGGISNPCILPTTSLPSGPAQC